MSKEKAYRDFTKMYNVMPDYFYLLKSSLGLISQTYIHSFANDHLDGAVESDAADDDALDPELGELARDLFFFGTAPRLRAAAIALSSSGTVSEMVLTAFLSFAPLLEHGDDDLLDLDVAIELDAEDAFRSTLWSPLLGVEM